MGTDVFGWSNPSVLKFINTIGTDPVQGIRYKTRTLVSKAFDRGWCGPPFSPFQLAELLNISVESNADVFDARIFSLGKDRLKIEYNPNQRPSRINFSIAHEIAHAILPDSEKSIKNREQDKLSKSQWELEFLCNVAASEILLPYSYFAEDANSINIHLDSMIELSEKYAASLEAVFLRFAEVVNKPFAVLIASFSSEMNDELIVDYFKPSRAFQGKIKKGFRIPADSQANECKNPGWTAKNLEHWDILNGFEFYMQAIGLPSLKKHKTGRVGVLIIPTESSVRIEEDIHFVIGDATEPRGEGNKIIAQVVNTFGGLGAGFGKAMARRWPKIVNELRKWKRNPLQFQLGESQLIQLNDNTFVLQMLAQKGYKASKGQIPLRYEALRSCLSELYIHCREIEASAHMPYIGAGEAGGDWSIIEGMIKEELFDRGIDVTVYALPGRSIIKRQQICQLEIFPDI